MSQIVRYAFFIALSLSAGLLMGFLFPPGSWFQSLEKPSFNPPGWVFGPVWTMLYVLIGIAGARVAHRGIRHRPLQLWWVQWLLNTAWTPAFFGLQWPELALGIILALWFGIVAFIVITARNDKVTALLFLPYLAWVSFATVLNASIAMLN